MANPTYESLRDEYAELWASMEIWRFKSADINATAQKIVNGKARYLSVSEQTKVPWFVIGLIHAMESGCNFATHLHNGDSLRRRTVQVPSGRPKNGNPPFTWSDSACDALLMKNLNQIEVWDIPRICYELERYNGWGYRKYHPNVLSPYLWSGTNHYARGKYVADGKWSATAVSGQSGAMAILYTIARSEKDVARAIKMTIPSTVPTVAADPVAEFPKADGPSAMHVAMQSSSVWSLINAKLVMVLGGFLGGLQALWDWLFNALGVLPAITSDVGDTMDSAEKISGWFHLDPIVWASISAAIVVPLLILVAIRHTADKQKVSTS